MTKIKKMNLGILGLILVLAVLAFSACGEKENSNDENTNTESSEQDTKTAEYKTSDELNLKGGNVVKI